MRKFLTLIVIAVGFTLSGVAPSSATPHLGPDQCVNIKGHQGTGVFTHNMYRRIGNPDRRLCAPVKRHRNYRLQCVEVVERNGVLYCRTSRGYRDPCTLQGGRGQYALNAERACDQNSGW